jgi:ATP-dependent RNA helicase DDX51/DBP6
MDQIKQNWLPILNQAVFGIGSNREMISQETLNANNLFLDKKKLIPYQKLLFSATLTRNPEKLEQINLFQPIFFSVGAEKLNKETAAEPDKVVANAESVKK